jgi:DNA-binding XRE family transcriptional regulator
MSACTSLRSHRQARDLTQDALATLLGRSRRTVVRWEAGGYVPTRVLEQLAAAWGTTVADLCTEPVAAGVDVVSAVRGLVDEHGAASVLMAVARALQRSPL